MTKLTDIVPYEEMNGWYVRFNGTGLWQILNDYWEPTDSEENRTKITEQDINAYWERDYFYFIGCEINLPSICAGCDRHKVYGDDFLCEDCRAD